MTIRSKGLCVIGACHELVSVFTLNPFRTAVRFWGQLGTKYLEFEWFAPKTGLQFLKG